MGRYMEGFSKALRKNFPRGDLIQPFNVYSAFVYTKTCFSRVLLTREMFRRQNCLNLARFFGLKSAKSLKFHRSPRLK